MTRLLRKFFFKIIQNLRISLYRILSNAAMIGERPNLKQPLHAVGHGVIEFEKGVNIGFFPSPYFFSSYAYLDVRSHTSKISIGKNSAINNGFVAIAEHSSIKIGANVLIGTHVEIYDSDFHGINVSDRNTSKSEWARPVEIEDNVFIGSNVRICKGVTIGVGSVIANGSIVTHAIPAGVIAAGNPAVVIRAIS